MNLKTLILVLFAVGTALIILFYGPLDIAASQWAYERRDTWLKPLCATISELGVITWWLVGALLLWFYLRYKTGNRYWADRVRFFFAAVAASGLAVIPLKLFFGKARPWMLYDENRYGFEWFAAPSAYGLHGFPSGHTTTAFAVATALALIAPRFAPAFFVGALIVGLSRIGVLFHYPSDVVAGAMLGTITTLLLYNFDKITFKRH
ncbi:phosphatase PAP2 family protein [Sulfurimonas sp. HSL-1656]|uniref:phosphatase PAP2 family protein n=1 Tax=Thiomicrolovo subterrani TaxID=3131934 RepID=UPI0031F7537F